jgi:hypothetical protein
MDRHMTRHIDRRTHRIDTHTTWPLHGVAASRELERLTQSGRPEHQLMQRAGASVAQLARAGPGAQQAVQRAGGAHAAGEAGQVQTAALH